MRKPFKLSNVSECMDHILWQLEKAFISQPLPEDSDSMQEPRSINVVKELFYGETRQVLTYADSKEAKDVRSTKTEEFSHLIMNTSKPTDIYAALDEYFGTQKVLLLLDLPNVTGGIRWSYGHP